MTTTLDKRVDDFIATERKLFIDGRWVDAASGRTFVTPNPATGDTLATVAEGDAEDVDRAVRAALREGKVPAELAGTLSTREVGDWVAGSVAKG